MQFIPYPSRKDWPAELQRPVQDFSQIEEVVNPILRRVKNGGDQALRELTLQIDNVFLGDLAVPVHQIAQAADQLSNDLKSAIGLAYKNIERFHAAQQNLPERIETMPGVVCWRKSVGIERVGLY